MNVDVDVGVILGRAAFDRCVVVNDILRQHADDAAIATIHPMCAWPHERLCGSAVFFKDCEIGRHIEFDVAAAATVVTPNHNQNSLFIA